MTGRLTIVVGLVVLVLVATILKLVRHRQLRSKYAMLWVFSAIGLAGILVLNAVEKVQIARVARQMGIVDGANLFLLLALVFLLVFAIHTSWELSRLENKVRRLAQELALEREAAAAVQAPVQSAVQSAVPLDVEPNRND